MLNTGDSNDVITSYSVTLTEERPWGDPVSCFVTFKETCREPRSLKRMFHCLFVFAPDLFRHKGHTQIQSFEHCDKAIIKKKKKKEQKKKEKKKKLNFNALSNSLHSLFLYSSLRGAGTDPKHIPSTLWETRIRVYTVWSGGKKSFIPHCLKVKATQCLPNSTERRKNTDNNINLTGSIIHEFFFFNFYLILTCRVLCVCQAQIKTALRYNSRLHAAFAPPGSHAELWGQESI